MTDEEATKLCADVARIADALEALVGLGGNFWNRTSQADAPSGDRGARAPTQAVAPSRKTSA